MSRLKFSPNLFLDVNELNHLVDFLETNGYKRLLKQIVKNYGVIRDENDSNFIVNKVNDNEVTVSPGLAIDNELNIISLKETQTLQLELNTEHYICIRYASNHIEEGTVNINSTGELIGNGTKFLDVLRGQPNFPTKVKFYGSSNNTQEYEVVNVQNNLYAIISGDFVPENDLKYSVVGTFTPGAVIPFENKEIYNYDDCEVFIVDGDGITTPSLNEGEYFISKITYDNGILYVNDIRYYNIFNYANVSSQNIPLVNLVNIVPKGKSEFTLSNSQEEYKVVNAELLMEFCYKVISFTISGNLITINNGTSNKYATVQDIPDGAFNGCLLFNKTNNTKALIVNYNAGVCTLINSNIQISVSDELYIIPNADEIEFEIVNNANSGENHEYPLHFVAKMSDGYVRCNISSRISENTVNPELMFKYRLISDNLTTIYANMDICTYTDFFDGNSKTYTSNGIEILMNHFNF